VLRGDARTTWVFRGVPTTPVFAIDVQIWMRVDAGQCDRARRLVAEMIEKAENYRFDFWQLFGATELCLVDAEIAVSLLSYQRLEFRMPGWQSITTESRTRHGPAARSQFDSLTMVLLSSTRLPGWPSRPSATKPRPSLTTCLPRWRVVNGSLDRTVFNRELYGVWGG
jgi:hypothetical protein